MPPKPQEQQKEDEMSYTSQLRRLGQLPDEKPENTIQKKYERRIRLRKIREATSNSEKDGEGATKLGCPLYQKIQKLGNFQKYLLRNTIINLET